jgi:prophage tail gpP-like protein
MITAGDIVLTVDGARYGGWKSADITRSMESGSGSFGLWVSERWPGQTEERPIAPGSRCVLTLAGEAVITGYVDDLLVRETADSHSIDVSGRDAACDLIDCSATNTPGEWRGVSLLDLAAELARPFGVAVRAEVDVGAPLDAKLEHGESAWRAIERACRLRAMLCMSDGAGNLVLTRAGTGRAEVRLVRGQNILSYSVRRSIADRYSEYRALGQRPSRDGEDPSQAAHGSALVTDPGVTRYRPMILTAEDAADGVTLQQRAQWEARVRAGRSQRIDVTVQGWRQKPGGRLWQPNERVTLELPRSTAELLVATVHHSLSERGSQTQLSLVPPDTYLPEPTGRGDAAW